jgi:hypothetical protein
MTGRAALLAALILAVVAPCARAAQVVGAEWAASSAGHLALVSQGNNGGTSTVRVVSPDGQVSAAETLAESLDTPGVAVGARGDAIVAWFDDEHRLLARYRPPGGPLGPEEEVAPNASTYIESLPLALDAAGNALIAFAREDGAGGLQVRARSTAGWGPPQTFGGTEIYRPKIALADNGSAVIAWGQQLPGTPRMQLAATWRTAGATFGSPQLISRARAGGTTPNVATNDRGDSVVAWIETHGHEPEFTVHGVFRAAGGAFGRPVRVSRVSEATAPSVAIFPDARMILAWRDNQTHRVEARVRSAAGGLSRPRILTHTLDLNTGPLAVAAGRGIVVWSDAARHGTVVRLAQATDDGHFPTVQTIAHVSSLLDPAVAPAGTAVTVVASPPFERGAPIRWRRISPS